MSRLPMYDPATLLPMTAADGQGVLLPLACEPDSVCCDGEPPNPFGNCPVCSDPPTPSFVVVSISGIIKGNFPDPLCTDCGQFNGSHILPSVGQCAWAKVVSLICPNRGSVGSTAIQFDMFANRALVTLNWDQGAFGLTKITGQINFATSPRVCRGVYNIPLFTSLPAPSQGYACRARPTSPNALAVVTI